MGDLPRVQVMGPLEPYAAGFGAELARLGYTFFSARGQMELVAHLSRWLAGEGLDAAALTPAVVEGFLAARRAVGYTSRLSPKAVAPLLVYLRGLGVAPPVAEVAATPVEKLLGRYRSYLISERGLRAETARGYVDLVRPVVAGRATAEGVDLEHLTAGDVVGFVLASCRDRAPGTAQLTVTALRSLLGFLHVEGLLAAPLATAVPSVANRRAGLPRFLEPDQVNLLLSSCDPDSTAGRRDFAMMTLMVRLGLRAGEVAALRLDDIDWRRGEIAVCGKGPRRDRLPLPVDVGQAVVDYLRHARPPSAADRCVFVRVKAPHRGLTPCGVTQAVVAAGGRAGLGSLTAHRLRHTAATGMLRAGAGLAEIGQVLRHRRPLTTAVYAKVDRDALRALARPWPGGAA
jgi:integrase/recombinase XerD